MIHPLLRGADLYRSCSHNGNGDSSPSTRGRREHHDFFVKCVRFIPSHEGQTWARIRALSSLWIHPLPRGADRQKPNPFNSSCDSSPPTRGGLFLRLIFSISQRFIPSHEGRTKTKKWQERHLTIHPLPRWADIHKEPYEPRQHDSSPPTRGGHSVFMRLSADLNTSLCNLHKCHSYLIRIFNMPKNPPHFHFFSNHFFVFQLPSPETFRLRMI